MSFLTEYRAKLAECDELRAGLTRKSGDGSASAKLIGVPDMSRFEEPSAWAAAAMDHGIKPATKSPVGLATGSVTGIATGAKASELVSMMCSTPDGGSKPAKGTGTKKTRKNPTAARPVGTNGASV